MRHYETIFIIHPELGEEETEEVIQRYQSMLEERNAFMVKVDKWGRRKLAYVVKKQSKGYYVLFEYGSGPEAIAEMERNFKIDESVIRYLTVKLEDEFDKEAAAKARAEAEAKAQAAAEAAATDEDQNEAAATDEDQNEAAATDEDQNEAAATDEDQNEAAEDEQDTDQKAEGQ